MTASLKDDLLSIPGVEAADIDGSSSAPEGLRISISEGADQKAVGGAIRRVLSSHGLGTDTQLPGESSNDIPSDEDVNSDASSNGVESDEVHTIIDLTDDGPETPDSAHEMELSDAPGSDLSASAEASVGVSASSSDPDNGDFPSFLLPRSSQTPQPTSISETQGVPIARIERVGVEEGRDGIVVTVTSSDGTEAKRSATSSESGVELAVVLAAAQLVNASAPDPKLVNLEDRRIEGTDMVMIVLDLDGKLVTGSAVVAAGRPFAIGRAAWAAMAM